VEGFTQSNARISKEVGGAFSAFDGLVTGDQCGVAGWEI
jgi:hypothetical protein